jgi:hypothetical protein
MLFVPLQQGRGPADVRLRGAGNIGFDSGRRSGAARPVSTLPRRRVFCRALGSGGFVRVAGCRLSPSRRCLGAICPLLSGRRSRSCSLVVVGAGDRTSAGSCSVDDLRELQRNAATRTGRPEYRASTAQTHADRRARRPEPAKLAVNPQLRACVQDRLAGSVQRPDGSVAGPQVSWRGRRHGRARTGAGEHAGVLSRSLVDCALTSPMMSRCGFLMRRSISRSMCRAAERCARS